MSNPATQFRPHPLPLLLGLIAWASLALQLSLYLRSFTPFAFLSALFHFLRFFTILTNLLLAFLFTAFAFPACRLRFLLNPKITTAAAVYAFLLELLYTTLLRWRLHPAGLQLVANIALHDLLPLGYLAVWFTHLPKRPLRPKDALPWLLYPVLYLPYNHLLSALTGTNPYPFLNPHVLGLPLFIAAVLALLLTFLLTGFLFINLHNTLARLAATSAQLS